MAEQSTYGSTPFVHKASPPQRHYLYVRIGGGAWRNHNPEGYPHRSEADAAFEQIVEQTEKPNRNRLNAIIGHSSEAAFDTINPGQTEVSTYCGQDCDIERHGPLAHYFGHDQTGAKIASALQYDADDMDDVAALLATGHISDIRGIGPTKIERIQSVIRDGRYYPEHPGMEWSHRVATLRRELDLNATQEMRHNGSAQQAIELLYGAEVALMRARKS